MKPVKMIKRKDLNDGIKTSHETVSLIMSKISWTDMQVIQKINRIYVYVYGDCYFEHPGNKLGEVARVSYTLSSGAAVSLWISLSRPHNAHQTLCTEESKNLSSYLYFYPWMKTGLVATILNRVVISIENKCGATQDTETSMHV